MTLAVVALTVLALGQLVAHFLTQRANAAERQALLDRIQAPDATHIAAMEALAPRQHQTAAPDEWEPVPLEGDLYIDDILDRVGAP